MNRVRTILQPKQDDHLSELGCLQLYRVYKLFVHCLRTSRCMVGWSQNFILELLLYCTIMALTSVLPTSAMSPGACCALANLRRARQRTCRVQRAMLIVVVERGERYGCCGDVTYGHRAAVCHARGTGDFAEN